MCDEQITIRDESRAGHCGCPGVLFCPGLKATGRGPLQDRTGKERPEKVRLVLVSDYSTD